MMIFIGVMNNRSQSAPLLSSRITQEQKIIGIETFFKNEFVRKASSFHDK